MASSLHQLPFILSTAGVLGLSFMAPPLQAVAQPERAETITLAAVKHTYHPQLVKLYTSECTKRLVKVQNNSPARATQICQCSLGQMQQRHSQGEAIAILSKAHSSSQGNPSAMPTVLSPYFTPCLALKG
ncbi:MAG: hypothetical protein HC934_04065 [Acaryochloridaceae cyanobacterium SU_2_1]|nr:hypothetical protein [Acaryochloridaceae cyanobacterium SU_2_1]